MAFHCRLIYTAIKMNLAHSDLRMWKYLPVKDMERGQRIKALERRAKQEREAQIFIEAPYRNVKLYDALLRSLSGGMRLTVAANITAGDEFIATHTVEEWQRMPRPDIEKRPTIFILGI